jgi:hypothetical protein
LGAGKRIEHDLRVNLEETEPNGQKVALDATLDFITHFDGTHGRVRTCTKDEWAAIALVFRAALEPMAWMAPSSLRKFCAPLKCLCVWVHTQGLPLSLSVVLDQQVIEAYCQTLAQHSVEERSLLRRVARENGMVTPTTPLGFKRRTIAKPYSSAELEALRVFASTMTNQNRRTSLLALLCLGAGCGLSRGHLRGVTAASVHHHGERLFVRSASRCSFVLADYVERLEAVCTLRPVGQLVGLQKRNVTSTVAAWTHQRVGIPALSGDRLRSSYIVALIDQGASLYELVSWTGSRYVATYAEYFEYARPVASPCPLDNTTGSPA